MTRPSGETDVDLMALYLSGWYKGPLDVVFHEDVEDRIFQTREVNARRHMSVDDALRESFDVVAAEFGIDRERLEAARGALSRYRFDLLPSDPDHPDALHDIDQFGIPLTNRDIAEIYAGEVPDGSD
ncbi:hypothetical protein [Streptomyces tirandamycinicus]|uniref:Uncharacterized protein n=1 Tax=Streptomyces tirandamycinicus TaxID=2174846 RepID=A0A2S1T1W7_9ACTN|nr:hypothetical protein [Streptomyces tirandamycinicus]AWI32663.1 hypothetical protein DDW44_30565 [Streptomyces tirandamycinicus]